MRYIRRVITTLLIISIIVFITALILLKLRKPYNDTLVIEAGSKLFSPAYFFVNLNDGAEYETDINDIELNHVGVNNIRVKLNGFSYKVSLEVVDTIYPNVVAKPAFTAIIGKEYMPEDFIEYSYDATDLKYEFETPIDMFSEGTREVVVCVTDEGGNVTRAKCIVTFAYDTIPPSIYGVRDRTVYKDSVVKYKDEVWTEDNYDGGVSLNVDTQAMNIHEVGDYPITYYCVDSSGNESRKTVIFSVVENTEEMVGKDIIDEKFEEIYNSIVTEDMTKTSIASAIYDYVSQNIEFVATSDKSDWEQNAYKGIMEKKGDCYTYYSVSRKLFEIAGIENMCVKRIEGAPANHYWNLINCGDGWYHYDACPRGEYTYIRIFMYTDKQLELYSKNISEGYYDFDKSLYPSTP